MISPKGDGHLGILLDKMTTMVIVVWRLIFVVFLTKCKTHWVQSIHILVACPMHERMNVVHWYMGFLKHRHALHNLYRWGVIYLYIVLTGAGPSHKLRRLARDLFLSAVEHGNYATSLYSTVGPVWLEPGSFQPLVKSHSCQPNISHW